MKKIILIALVLFQIEVIKAQQSNPASQPILNGTLTDPSNPSGPTNTSVYPNPPDFMKNTFNWMNSNFDYFDPTTGTDRNCLAQSPFYAAGIDYLTAIAKNSASDFTPQGGWELIKQNFGYYYGSGYTPSYPPLLLHNCGPVENWQSGGNLNDPNSPTTNYTQRLYFLL